MYFTLIIQISSLINTSSLKRLANVIFTLIAIFLHLIFLLKQNLCKIFQSCYNGTVLCLIFGYPNEIVDVLGKFYYKSCVINFQRFKSD